MEREGFWGPFTLSPRQRSPDPVRGASPPAPPLDEWMSGLLEGKMIKQEFLRLARQYPVAAAMKSNEDMQVALESDALLLFLLKGDAFQLAPFVLEAHHRGKGVVVHVDLVSGIGKDRAGIQY